jgi:hypothetical protein
MLFKRVFICTLSDYSTSSRMINSYERYISSFVIITASCHTLPVLVQQKMEGKGILVKKHLTLGSIALLVALLCVVLTVVPTLAHEKRHVGPYTFVVGFLDEPAYANVKNSLDLTVCDGSSCNYTVQNGAQVLSNPVNDVDQTLKVEVSTGGSAISCPRKQATIPFISLAQSTTIISMKSLPVAQQGSALLDKSQPIHPVLLILPMPNSPH